jgi:hypothetical protein
VEVKGERKREKKVLLSKILQFTTEVCGKMK